MSHAARVRTTPQRGRTADGVVMTTGGPGNGEIAVKAPVVRATHFQQQILPQEVVRVGRGG